jgi:hypothetical protein
MAKERLGSNAIFSGPQKGLTIIGNHCYGYSGSIAITSQIQTMLSFTTGKTYNIVRIQTGITQNGGGAQSDDIETVIKLNGNVVMSRMLSHNNESGLLEAIDLLIPPLTFVEVTCDNIQGTTSTPTQVSLVGKVYS